MSKRNPRRVLGRTLPELGTPLERLAATIATHTIAHAQATCADCGHTRAEHSDPRFPCNVLACACRGFREA